MMDNTQKWFAGVDWASQKHDVWLTDGNGKYIGKKTFEHSGEGLAQMCDWLLEKSQARPDQIHVGIETPHGPVVDTLLDRGFHVYAISPKQLDRFRDRFTMSGAKDDSRDAETMASSLRTDMKAFRKVELTEATVVEMREWSRMGASLTTELNRAANRMRDQLWRYYPQINELGDVTETWIRMLWKAAPTPAKAARLRKATVEKILNKARITRIDASAVLEILKKPAITVAPGVSEAAQAHINVLCEQIELVDRQLKDVYRNLDRLSRILSAPLPSEDGDNEPDGKPRQRDAEIVRSMSGIGRINQAALLTEASFALEQRDYHALRALSGVAPVTRRSGKSCIVIRRYACHPRVREAVYHWADYARKHDPVSKAKYEALRARKHSHARALRSVGDRLLYVLCALLKKGELYDPGYAASKTAC